MPTYMHALLNTASHSTHLPTYPPTHLVIHKLSSLTPKQARPHLPHTCHTPVESLHTCRLSSITKTLQVFHQRHLVKEFETAEEAMV
ncbi:hypothetical protein E2C01_094308 [Portunus trituberculatus]|uniref:Uncharacterized protein n=1 Tax=Portunus trituberculatus TaxID=210409 RepID=A0A5B7JLI5_PORTR|nr:hypothetical protein [Portunus trituberculatus]